jgi:hypothetical protein
MFAALIAVHAAPPTRSTLTVGLARVEQEPDAPELLAQPIGVVSVERRVVTGQEPLAQRDAAHARIISPERLGGCFELRRDGGDDASAVERET